MIKNLLIFILLFFSCPQIKAKEKDSLAKYSSKQLSLKSSMAARQNERPLLWKVYLDAMMRKNPSDKLKGDTHYNLAWDFYRYQDYEIESSIKMVNQSIGYFKKSNSEADLFSAYISLSTLFSLKGDNENALRNLHEIKKLKKPNSKNDLYYLKFQSSTARIYAYIGDFQQAVSVIRQSNKDIDHYIVSHPKTPKDTLIDLIYAKKSNYIDFMQSYNFQKKLDSTAYYLKKVKALEKNGFTALHNYVWAQESFYLVLSEKYDAAIAKVAEADKKGYIDTKDRRYRSLYFLAICWQQKKDYAKSLAYCEQGLAIDVKIASYINFELEFYKLALANSEMLGNAKKATFYSKKYNKASQNFDYAKKSQFIAKLYQQDVNVVKEELALQKSTLIYLYCIFGALVLFSAYTAWQYLKARRDRKKFKEIISTFEARQIEPPQEESTNPKTEDEAEIETAVQKSNARQPQAMSGQADEKIAKQLATFERKLQFLSPNISLSTMAGNFDTNAGYLSACIKKYKDTNFNGYINDLRIDYIMIKLKNFPEYSNYKISYLAEECGFSSHTVFIRVFTKRTAITPSKFISFLKTGEFDS